MNIKLPSHQVWILFTFVVLVVLLFPAEGARLRRRDGPPKRPDAFRSVAELNKYLADLTDYYTVLGRPRFGKRSEREERPERPLENTPFSKDFLRYYYNEDRLFKR